MMFLQYVWIVVMHCTFVVHRTKIMKNESTKEEEKGPMINHLIINGYKLQDSCRWLKYSYWQNVEILN